MVPGTDPAGKSILSVIVKRTYLYAHGEVSHSKDQAPLYSADIPADPANFLYTENLAESDIVPFKPNTDVVLVGKAYTPKRKRAYNLECELHVGSLSKKIMVMGNRKLEYRILRGFNFSDPEPFNSHDLGYSNAFGGRAKSRDGTLYPFPPNPLGKGFYLKDSFEEYDEIVVPNLEDPDNPIDPETMIVDKFDMWSKAPKPISMGWTRQSFFPRYIYCGIIPEMLPGGDSLNLPINQEYPKMNFQFFQGASEGLCVQLLKGDETVRLVYLSQDHPIIEFALPGDRPNIIIHTDTERFTPQPSLQTVLINNLKGTIEMVWRGAVEYGGIEEFKAGQLFGFEIAG
jgi:hypothetical protein